MVVNLNCKLLGTLVVLATGRVFEAVQVADFLREGLAVSTPGDEDGVGGGGDEAKLFSGGFERIGAEGMGFRIEAGHVARYNVRLVPVGGSRACKPDGLLEVGADGRKGEEVFRREIGENSGAGDGGGGGEIGERFGNGVVGGLEEEDLTGDGLAGRVGEFAIAIATAGGLGEGIEAALGAIDNGEADIDARFDELRGDENDRAALVPESFDLGKHGHDMTRAHAGGKMEGGGVSIKFLIECFGGFGSIEYKETSVRGVFQNVSDKSVVVDGVELVGFDAFEDGEKCLLIVNNGRDFLRRDADSKVIAFFQGWLGCGAEDGGAVDI